MRSGRVGVVAAALLATAATWTILAQRARFVGPPSGNTANVLPDGDIEVPTSGGSGQPGVDANPAAEFHPDIPKAWDDEAVATMEVPLAERDRSPRYMSAEEYYKLKVRPIYRSYPAYAKGREPAGYIESLKQRDP